MAQRPLTDEEREVNGLPTEAIARVWRELPRTVPELAQHLLRRFDDPARKQSDRNRRKRERRRKRKHK